MTALLNGRQASSPSSVSLAVVGALFAFAAAVTALSSELAAIAALADVAALIGVTLAAVLHRFDIGCGILAVAGALQPALTALTQTGISLYVDNVTFGVVAIVAVALAMQHGQQRQAVVLFIYGLILLYGTARATSLSAGAYQARQLIIPGALLLAGAVVRARFGLRSAVTKVAAIIGTISIIYSMIEFAAGPIIPPALTYGYNSRSSVVSFHGLPANYLFYSSANQRPLIRIGGFLCNPPVDGVLMGTIGVILYWTVSNRMAAVTGSILALAVTVGTYSRDGVLVYLLGIGLPLLIARIGRVFAGSVVILGMILAGPYFSDQGASARHLNGLLVSLGSTVTHPLGRGFGHFGNAFSAGSGTTAAGESLLGVLLVGCGAVGLLGIGWILFRALARCTPDNWPAGLCVGALVASAFAESAGALSGSTLLWICAGMGLVSQPARAPAGE